MPFKHQSLIFYALRYKLKRLFFLLQSKGKTYVLKAIDK